MAMRHRVCHVVLAHVIADTSKRIQRAADAAPAAVAVDGGDKRGRGRGAAHGGDGGIPRDDHRMHVVPSRHDVYMDLVIARVGAPSRRRGREEGHHHVQLIRRGARGAREPVIIGGGGGGIGAGGHARERAGARAYAQAAVAVACGKARRVDTRPAHRDTHGDRAQRGGGVGVGGRPRQRERDGVPVSRAAVHGVGRLGGSPGRHEVVRQRERGRVRLLGEQHHLGEAGHEHPRGHIRAVHFHLDTPVAG